MIVKKLKKFLLDDLAEPLFFKNTSAIVKNTKFKKKYYIINRTPGSGMFSNVTYILNHIIYAKKKGLVPVVDMENFTTIYNEKRIIKNTFNAWEYYFEPVSKESLAKIYKNCEYILSSGDLIKKFKNSITIDKNLIKEFRKIKFKKYILHEANLFKKKKFNSKDKIIGLHLRSTSYKKAKNHSLVMSLKIMREEIDRVIKKDSYNKIFCVTEDMKYYNYLKKIYKKKIIFFPSFRSYKNDAFKIYPRKLHRYQLGREIVIETILLSKCDGILYSGSNVATAASLLAKPGVKLYEINLGFNSSNKYIARWLWYIKNLLPKNFGGLMVKNRSEKNTNLYNY